MDLWGWIFLICGAALPFVYIYTLVVVYRETAEAGLPAMRWTLLVALCGWPATILVWSFVGPRGLRRT